MAFAEGTWRLTFAAADAPIASCFRSDFLGGAWLGGNVRLRSLGLRADEAGGNGGAPEGGEVSLERGGGQGFGADAGPGGKAAGGLEVKAQGRVSWVQGCVGSGPGTTGCGGCSFRATIRSDRAAARE